MVQIFHFSFRGTHLGQRAFSSLTVSIFSCGILLVSLYHTKPLPSFFFRLNTFAFCEKLTNVLCLCLCSFSPSLVGIQLSGWNWCCSSPVVARENQAWSLLDGPFWKAWAWPRLNYEDLSLTWAPKFWARSISSLNRFAALECVTASGNDAAVSYEP